MRTAQPGASRGRLHVQHPRNANYSGVDNKFWHAIISGHRTMATQEPHLRSHAIEDYAKAIYVLETRGREPVSTTALAERLEGTPGSGSAMVKKLADIDPVTPTPSRGVRLTEEGRRTALEVIRHHRLLELFLAEVLE